MRQDSSEMHTPESIRKVTARAAAGLTVANGVADEMGAHGIQKIEIKYQAAVLRFLKDINRWTSAATDALNEKLDEIGAFRAQEPTPPKADKKSADKHKGG